MAIPTVVKRPIEEFAIGFKFVAPDLQPNETIDSAEVTVEPSEAQGIQLIGNPVIEFDQVSQFIIGGEENREYHVRFKVTTSVGTILEHSIFVKVRDLTP